MIFKDEHDFSLLPKIVFMTAISCASILDGYLMFTDVNELYDLLKPYAINGDFLRRILLMFFLVFCNVCLNIQ